MPRRKVPDNETEDEKRIRLIKEKISGNADRSAKVAWKRKLSNLEALYEKVRPIEEEILTLMAKKTPILDEMQVLREEMVNECVHPFDYLIVKEDGQVICKFCNNKLKVVNG